MSKNEKQPDPKEIKRLLTEYKKERDAADQEVEKADQAIYDYKLAVVQEDLKQAPEGSLPRAPVVVLELEDDRHYQDLVHKRKMALGDRSDWKRRIKLLEAALRAVGG